MSQLLLLYFVSTLLQFGGCQVRVPKLVYAWLESQVTLDCRADTKEEIKQITWEIEGVGTWITFLTYRNDTGPKYHTSYGNRVRFTGNGYKDGSIQILNVSLADQGVFKCVFTTFPSGTIEGKIQFQVSVLPTVRQELNKDIITPCVNLVAECLAISAKPAAEIQWITNGINFTSNEDSIVQSNGTMNKRSQLFMTSTSALFGHQVLCLVYQPEIPVQYQENITVNVTLTNIQFPPQMVQIEVLKNDQEVRQLYCKSEANPRAEYIWKRKNKQKGEDLLPGASAVLNATDDGLYICEATNALGKNRGFFYIHTTKDSIRYPIGFFSSVVLILALLLLLFVCYTKRSSICEKPFCELPCFQGRRGQNHERAIHARALYRISSHL
ncbi:nectin-3-like protein isoform 3-T4 [Anomaloglossus baeobatrachus]|uniref:nectin-3-like protein isoform X3 n=1 Tax=Anomaloglossus baeobatrachus TaxID=238106 RepID=UPI003F507E07